MFLLSPLLYFSSNKFINQSIRFSQGRRSKGRIQQRIPFDIKIKIKITVENEMGDVGIDMVEVERALKMLKNGKAAGTDNIIGEFLKYGGDAVR